MLKAYLSHSTNSGNSLSLHGSYFTGARDNVIFAVTQHGGHLGFFEGWLVYGRSLTWLDRLVVQYVRSALSALAQPSPGGESVMTSQ